MVHGHKGMSDWYTIEVPRTHHYSGGGDRLLGPHPNRKKGRAEVSRLHRAGTHQKLRLKVKSPKTEHSNKIEWSEGCRLPRYKQKTPFLEVSATTSYQSRPSLKASNSAPVVSLSRDKLTTDPLSPTKSCPVDSSPGDGGDEALCLYDGDDCIRGSTGNPSVEAAPRMHVRVALPLALLATENQEFDVENLEGDDASMLFLGTPRSGHSQGRIDKSSRKDVRRKRLSSPRKSMELGSKVAWAIAANCISSPGMLTTKKKTTVQWQRKCRSSSTADTQMDVHDHAEEQLKLKAAKRVHRTGSTRVRSRGMLHTRPPVATRIMSIAVPRKNCTKSESLSADQRKKRLPFLDTGQASSLSLNSSDCIDASDSPLELSAQSVSSPGQTGRESLGSRVESAEVIPLLVALPKDGLSHSAVEFLSAERQPEQCKDRKTADSPICASSHFAAVTMAAVVPSKTPASSILQHQCPASKPLVSKSTPSAKQTTPATVPKQISLVCGESSPAPRVSVLREAPKIVDKTAIPPMVNIVAFLGPSAAVSGYTTAIGMLEEQPELAAVPSSSATASMNGWLPLHLVIMLHRGPAHNEKETAGATLVLEGKSQASPAIVKKPNNAAVLLKALLEAYPEAAGLRFRSSASAEPQLPLFVALNRRWGCSSIEALIRACPSAAMELQALNAKEALRDEPRLKRRTWARKVAAIAGCDPEVIALLPTPRKVSKGPAAGTITWEL